MNKRKRESAFFFSQSHGFLPSIKRQIRSRHKVNPKVLGERSFQPQADCRESMTDADGDAGPTGRRRPARLLPGVPVCLSGRRSEEAGGDGDGKEEGLLGFNASDRKIYLLSWLDNTALGDWFYSKKLILCGRLSSECKSDLVQPAC